MLQQEVKQYWEGEARHYSEGIAQELGSFKKEAWKELIREYMPEGEGLKVLDIGTGPGFLAYILAEMGHKVSAIDCSENMLEEAKNNLAVGGLEAHFSQMDSHELKIFSNSYDLIINRNVVWTLHNPQKAYREWHRVLKPGGKLMVFDSNFAHRFFDEDLNQRYKKALEGAAAQGFHRRGHVDQSEGDRLTRQLYLSSKKRPQWDMCEMLDIGFKKVTLDYNIIHRIYNEQDMMLWSTCPLFLVCGEK